MSDNNNLGKAKKVKNDEFYTRLTDVEKELENYKAQLKNKVVYCNCDTASSAFVTYFVSNFKHIGLKGLIATGFNKDGKGTIVRYDGNVLDKSELIGDGDFRSKECLQLLKECDVVVTNPPFSLFREFVSTVLDSGKQFLVIGSWNAVTYKDIFGLIKDNTIWLGYNPVKQFNTPDGGTKNFGNICWYTNLDVKKRHEKLVLFKKYTPEEYPKYDNYDAINVDKVSDIPEDYNGVMGVPITFLDKYNPEQFTIISSNNIRRTTNTPHKEHGLIKDKEGAVNGKPRYVRIPIHRV